MSDKTAREEAQKIREKFWRQISDVLGPGKASQTVYREELEELIEDARSRLAALDDDEVA